MEATGREELFPEEGCEQRRWRGVDNTTSCHWVPWAGTVFGGVRGDVGGITVQAHGAAWGQMVSPLITVSNTLLQLGTPPEWGRIKDIRINRIK